MEMSNLQREIRKFFFSHSRKIDRLICLGKVMERIFFKKNQMEEREKDGDDCGNIIHVSLLCVQLSELLGECSFEVDLNSIYGEKRVSVLCE
jgi:hypothetical protein